MFFCFYKEHSRLCDELKQTGKKLKRSRIKDFLKKTKLALICFLILFYLFSSVFLHR